MHTAEAAAAPAAAPTAAPAAPGTCWQFFTKCSDPSRSDPSSLFQIGVTSSWKRIQRSYQIVPGAAGAVAGAAAAASAAASAACIHYRVLGGRFAPL